MTTTSRLRRSGAALALTALGCLSGATDPSAAATATPSHAAARQADVQRQDLLRPDDVAAALEARRISSTTGRGSGDWALSACTGETSMRDVAGRDVRLLHAELSGRLRDSGASFEVVQHLAGEPTARRAGDVHHDIAGLLEDCRHEPRGHWRYGRVHRISTDAGVATWMAAIDGDGTPDGGILVARSGRHLAVVEAMSPGSRPRTMRGLALRTLRRLG